MDQVYHPRLGLGPNYYISAISCATPNQGEQQLPSINGFTGSSYPNISSAESVGIHWSPFEREFLPDRSRPLARSQVLTSTGGPSHLLL